MNNIKSKKKIYQSPQIDVVELETEGYLMVEQSTKGGGKVNDAEEATLVWGNYEEE